MTSIEGAVALVSGGRRGLGRAYVDALTRHGAVKVYATARQPASSEDPRIVAETLDVTDAEQAKAALCGPPPSSPSAASAAEALGPA